MCSKRKQTIENPCVNHFRSVVEFMDHHSLRCEGEKSIHFRCSAAQMQEEFQKYFQNKKCFRSEGHNSIQDTQPLAFM